MDGIKGSSNEFRRGSCLSEAFTLCALKNRKKKKRSSLRKTEVFVESVCIGCGSLYVPKCVYWRTRAFVDLSVGVSL